MPDIPQYFQVAYPNTEEGDPYIWHRYELVDSGNLGEAPDPEPLPEPELPADWTDITTWSQRDPRWADQIYSDSASFKSYGCFVTCVAMIAQAAYPEGQYLPPYVAAQMREVNAFNGAYLSNPSQIPVAFPRLEWGGAMHWRLPAADLGTLKTELDWGPVICELAWDPTKPVTWKDEDGKRHWNQHFVLLLTLDGDDGIVADPWDGKIKRISESRYALAGWGARRTFTGIRILRMKGDS